MGAGGISAEDEPVSSSGFSLLLSLPPGEGSTGEPDAADKQHETVGAHCLVLSPGTSTHYLGNPDYSSCLCLSVPICIMDTIAYTWRGL